MSSQEIVPGLNLEITPEGDVAVFSIVKQVGLRDVSRAVDMGLRLLAKGPYRIVLDFSEATRLRVLGLGFISYYCKVVASKGGRMVIVAPPEGTAAELMPFDLRQMFPVYDTRDEAIAAARCPG